MFYLYQGLSEKFSYKCTSWKSKINESESTYLTFTLRNDPSPPVYLKYVEIPPTATVIYLGLHLDNKLNWVDHIIKKRKQIDLRRKELYWLLGRKSQLSVDNKLLLYKCIMHLYGHRALNYGAVLVSPISQSYRNVSRKY